MFPVILFFSYSFFLRTVKSRSLASVAMKMVINTLKINRCTSRYLFLIERPIGIILFFENKFLWKTLITSRHGIKGLYFNKCFIIYLLIRKLHCQIAYPYYYIHVYTQPLVIGTPLKLIVYCRKVLVRSATFFVVWNRKVFSNQWKYTRFSFVV